MPGSPSPAPGAAMPSLDPLADPSVREWDRTYALFMHLSLILTHVIPVPIVPVLVMWLIKKDQSHFVNDHGKEALNFQISLLIYMIVGGILVAACGIGIAVIVATYVLAIVGMIQGAIAASKSRYYRYPACLRLIS